MYEREKDGETENLKKTPFLYKKTGRTIATAEFPSIKREREGAKNNTPTQRECIDRKILKPD